MGFENNRGRGGNDRGDRAPRRFSSNGGGGRSQGGPSGNSGRIENFEKPLIELLKSINEKLDILIENSK
ncbi:hypothetical protein SCHIN_v1c08000 [Spiroplasma chinense]|uniref:Uncharacterized protein n=1 Tax=Spiroplasma chinense TaxID=216932 RepID=A0A5B9Y598_9MOLU|nr:hypothetical protein [Spiroplasma chinense]QEH61995.1 hypothetical protein SCHIN_v1c08000 [Spiroplasma chinense]